MTVACACCVLRPPQMVQRALLMAEEDKEKGMQRVAEAWVVRGARHTQATHAVACSCSACPMKF